MNKIEVWILIMGVWFCALGMNWQAREQHLANHIMTDISTGNPPDIQNHTKTL
jgi:hypothetical protein